MDLFHLMYNGICRTDSSRSMIHSEYGLQKVEIYTQMHESNALYIKIQQPKV